MAAPFPYHGLGRIRRLARGLWGHQRGAAAVEFALILPIMLAVYIGVLEGSTLIIVDRKVQGVAGAVGDLVARAENEVTADQLRDYFRAANGIMSPYPSGGVVQVITAVTVASNGTTGVSWQAKFQNGTYTRVTGAALPRTFNLPQPMVEVAKGKNLTVIAAEASYSYIPLFGIMFDAEVPLYRSNFYLPRFGGTIALKP
jgi:Flp pilus assembly protein TadG